MREEAKVDFPAPGRPTRMSIMGGAWMDFMRLFGEPPEDSIVLIYLTDERSGDWKANFQDCFRVGLLNLRFVMISLRRMHF